MVPRMLGWGVQKYANVPASPNVCERLWPASKMPVSKLRSSAVAEWGVGPSLVQVTVSPTSIVTEAGANWKSLIVTPVSAAAAARGALPERRGLASAGVRRAGAASAAGCEAGVSAGTGSPAPGACGTAVPGAGAPDGAAPDGAAPDGAAPDGAPPEA